MTKIERMKRILLIIALNFITLALCAQIFSGKVANKSGEGIPYAALYFKELMQGFTTDENGLFSIPLSAGTYSCEVTSLGYMPMQVNIDMTAGSIHRDIILQERVYTLREVNINSKAEDPAYAVMRKAIAFAPRNLHRVQSYQADMYLKGSGRLDAIPSILKISKEIREISKKYTGKVFLLEEQREITYHSPNTWEGKVLAYSNTFPEEVRVEIGISTINFYQPQLMGKISPLSPGAFSYYRYRLEDCYVEGEQLINKIKVIPRNDNPQLLSGDLYIVDGCWCIAAASLQLQMTGAKMDIQVTCKEIKPDVYLPVSVSMESQFSLMGLKASAGYLAAIQYHDVMLSSSNVSNTQSTQIEVVQKPSKQEAKLEKLLNKEDITIREAYYLNKLMEQASRPDSLSSTHKYERVSARRQSRLTTDSLASTKDSLYWLAVRSVPLKPEEQASYDFKRELTLNKDSSIVQKSTKNQRVSNVLNTAINGHTFESKDKKSWLAMHDLFSYVPEYNQVDGWWVGAKVSMGYRFSQATSLSFTPSVY